MAQKTRKFLSGVKNMDLFWSRITVVPCQAIYATISNKGDIYLEFMSIGETIDELLLIWAASQEDEYVDRIAYLPIT